MFEESQTFDTFYRIHRCNLCIGLVFVIFYKDDEDILSFLNSRQAGFHEVDHYGLYNMLLVLNLLVLPVSINLSQEDSHERNELKTMVEPSLSSYSPQTNF